MRLRTVAWFVLSAMAAGCSVSPGSVSPSETAPASPTAVASSASSDTPSPMPAVDRVAFELALELDGGEIYAVAAFDGGFVAGGCHHEILFDGGVQCAGALLLMSPDGRSWAELAPPDGADDRIVGLSDTPLGLLAFGMTNHEAPPQVRSVWRLVDAVRWEPYAIDAPSSIVFWKAVALGDQTVLFGADTAYDMYAEDLAWATTDGTTWTTGTTPMSTKVVAPPGLVAVGDECIDVCAPDAEIRIFRSTDGLTWTDDVLPTEIMPGRTFTVGVAAGHLTIGGAAAAGDSAELWIEEPAGWRHVVLDNSAGHAITNLIEWQSGSIAVGRADGDAGLKAWWSADGQDWTPVALDGLGDGRIGGAAGTDPIVLILDYRLIVVSA